MQLEKSLSDATLATLSVGEHASAFQGQICVGLVGVGNSGTVNIEGESAVRELLELLQHGLRSKLRNASILPSQPALSMAKQPTQTQRRVLAVLERMTEAVRRDADDADVYAEALEGMLNELGQNDFFGTEGQSDPRGDFRNGEWRMARVEGIDN